MAAESSRKALQDGLPSPETCFLSYLPCYGIVLLKPRGYALLRKAGKGLRGTRTVLWLEQWH